MAYYSHEWSIGERRALFEHLYSNVLWKANIRYIGKLMQYYIKELEGGKELEESLTERQKVLYWLKLF